MSKEIKEYMDWFKDYTLEQILEYLGAQRDFFWKNMTPEDKKIFLKTQLKEQMGDFYSENELEKVLKPSVVIFYTSSIPRLNQK